MDMNGYVIIRAREMGNRTPRSPLNWIHAETKYRSEKYVF